jgi:hypothetical protein
MSHQTSTRRRVSTGSLKLEAWHIPFRASILFRWRLAGIFGSQWTTVLLICLPGHLRASVSGANDDMSRAGTLVERQTMIPTFISLFLPTLAVRSRKPMDVRRCNLSHGVRMRECPVQPNQSCAEASGTRVPQTLLLCLSSTAQHPLSHIGRGSAGASG